VNEQVMKEVENSVSGEGSHDELQVLFEACHRQHEKCACYQGFQHQRPRGTPNGGKQNVIGGNHGHQRRIPEAVSVRVGRASWIINGARNAIALYWSFCLHKHITNNSRARAVVPKLFQKISPLCGKALSDKAPLLQRDDVLSDSEVWHVYTIAV
jgi:hypothetical protein